jgi:hypothetical protein
MSWPPTERDMLDAHHWVPGTPWRGVPMFDSKYTAPLAAKGLLARDGVSYRTTAAGIARLNELGGPFTSPAASTHTK